MILCHSTSFATPSKSPLPFSLWTLKHWCSHCSSPWPPPLLPWHQLPLFACSHLSSVLLTYTPTGPLEANTEPGQTWLLSPSCPQEGWPGSCLLHTMVCAQLASPSLLDSFDIITHVDINIEPHYINSHLSAYRKYLEPWLLSRTSAMNPQILPSNMHLNSYK